MIALLFVVILVIALEIGGAGVHADERYVADVSNLAAYAIRHLGNLEYTRDKMHVYRVDVEVHLLRHCYPTHACVFGVLTGEIDYLPTLDAAISDRAPKCDMRRNQKHYCGFAGACRACQRIDRATLQNAIHDLVWRNEVRHELGARSNKPAIGAQFWNERWRGLSELLFCATQRPGNVIVALTPALILRSVAGVH